MTRLPRNGRWQFASSRTWNGSAWATSGAVGDGVIPFGAKRILQAAQGSVITRSVASMPLAANSAATAKWVAANKLLGFGEATVLNRYAYSIPVHVVDSSHPGCHFETFEIRQGGLSAQLYRILRDTPIPCPDWARPAAGGDAALSIYDVATGIMREYFNVQRTADGLRWSAATGGYYIGSPGLDDLGTTNPALQLTEGSSAVVRMLNPVGQIGIDEARKGVINHALQFTSANCRMDKTRSVLKEGGDPTVPSDWISKIGAYSWPAQMGDGASLDDNAHCQGQWFRLPASLDADDPFLNFNPFTRVLIRAAQRYGGFSTDKNLFVHAFNVEPGTEEKRWFGADPWAAGGELDRQYGTLRVDDFPWHLTEWAPVDWGRPAPPEPRPSPVH